MSTEAQLPPQEAPAATAHATDPATTATVPPTTEQTTEKPALGPAEGITSDKGTAEAVPNVVNPVKEEKVGKNEVKVEAKPINEGILNYKAPGLKGLLFSKKYFWLSDAPLESKNLSAYVGNEKSKDVGRGNAAHASQTGKGLLFFAKRAEDKDHPQGILNLADLTDLAKGNFNDFSAHFHGQKHSFQAQTKAERDSWLVTLEPKAAEAQTAREGIVGSEGYKSQLETYGKPGATTATTSKSRSLSRPNKASKSRERAKETTSSKEAKDVKAEISGKQETPFTTSANPAPQTDGPADPAATTTTKDAKKDTTGEHAGEIAAGAAAGGATAAAVTRKESSDDDKKDKKGRSQSRGNKRGSIFGGLLGKKDEPEEKKAAKKADKEDKKEKTEQKNIIAAVKKDEKKEEKREEKEEKKAELEAEKAEKKVEKEEKKAEKDAEKAEKEVEKAEKHEEKSTKAEEAAAVAAPGAAAATGAAASKKPEHEKKTVPETVPATTTEPEKPLDTIPVSTTKEKPNKRSSVFGGLFSKKDATSPVEKKEETTPVAAEPPQLENPVTSPTYETPGGVTITKKEPETAVESPPAGTASTPTDKRRTSFFSGLGTKKEKKPEIVAEEEKKKKPETTSGDELTDSEKKKKEGGFGGLLRKASRAQPKKDPKASKTDAAGVPLPKGTSAAEKAIKEGEKKIEEGEKKIEEGEKKIEEGEKAIKEATTSGEPSTLEGAAPLAKAEEPTPVETKA